MATRTINLTGAEFAVTGLDGANAHIRNDSAAAIYAAKSADITVGADGVLSIPAGQSARLDSISGAFYLLGTGSVQLVSNDYTESPFKAVSAGGGADVIPNAAGIVTLDGLQGGVPFSDITVRGKNLFDGALTIGMVSVSTGILINTDAGANRYISTTNHISVEPKTTYTAQNSENKTIDAVIFFDSSKNVIGHKHTGAAGFNSFTTPDNCKFVRWRYLFDSVQSDTSGLTNIQLEAGETATEYEPPIIGQKITLTACGKNLLKYPYADTTKTENGITFTDNGDGSITANGTATNTARFYISLPLVLPIGEYTVSDGSHSAESEGCHIQVYTYDAPYTTLATTFTNKSFVLTKPTALTVRIPVSNGYTVDNLVIKPQIERGREATDYQSFSGSVTTITPDSNPYTVPNDIRQQDGTNNVSVSAGEVSVTGVKRNAAVKRIWDKLDELTTAIIVSNGETAE